jgi:hypothetical protein
MESLVPKPKKPRRWPYVVVALIAVWIIANIGSGSSVEPVFDSVSATLAPAASTASSSDSPTAASSDSDAYKLAVIDGDLSPSDATVRQYQRALDALAGSCKRDPNTSHGDYAVTTRRLAADQGVSVSVLEVLKGVALSAEEQAALGVDCAGVYAVFTVLLTEG